MSKTEPTFLTSLISGGVAGTAVDVALFPLDTIKTRLQSSQGFLKAGGFRGVYAGLSVAAVGSAPGAALFFSTYDTMKQSLAPAVGEDRMAVAHMGAACCGETVACLVRVPTEVLKQRMQAGMHDKATEAFGAVLKRDGPMGLYRGFGTTVAREIPFALIQFPLYEALKSQWATLRGADEGPLLPVQGALCGSCSGAFAAACTTPLDVVKTRLMLSQANSADPSSLDGTLGTLRRIAAEEGAGALFSGIVPRVCWMFIGGFVFFGAYEQAKSWLVARQEEEQEQ